MSMIPNEMSGVNVFELGSGWGNIIFSLAIKYRGAKISAFEVSFVPWLFSMFIKRVMRFSNITIHRKNFFSTSLRNADYVICYLYPAAMEKLKSKFEKELKSGTVIISNAFSVPSWKPVKVVSINSLVYTNIYLYEIGKSDV